MVFLASVLTQMLVAGTLLLAAVLGSAVAYYYVQARRRETVETEREAEELSQRDAELSHIRQRIEEIYERQQTGSETQFARVNQELEQLQMNLDAKGRQIDGVQGQMRYELKRHEEEITELRNQLREAIEVFAAAALPAAQPAAPALPAYAEPAPAASAPEPKPAPKPDPPQSVIYAPPTEEDPSSPPAFTPLGDLLKDDHELLDDLFGGTDLDSAAPPPEPSDRAPEPFAAPLKPIDEPEALLPTEEAPALSSTGETPTESLAESDETHDTFAFVDVDTSMPTDGWVVPTTAEETVPKPEHDDAELTAPSTENTEAEPDTFASVASESDPAALPDESSEEPAPEPPARDPFNGFKPSFDPFTEANKAEADRSHTPQHNKPTAAEVDPVVPDAFETISLNDPGEPSHADETDDLPTADLDHTSVEEHETLDVDAGLNAGGDSDFEAWSGDTFDPLSLDAPAEPEPLAEHSGDGMSTPAFADPFADATPEHHPEPVSDGEDTTELEPFTMPANDSLAFDASELLSLEPEPELTADDTGEKEDLTVLSAVDSAMQQRLYGLNITTIEAIARWNRSDAQRIADQLTHTSEEDIMDRWVFEAQSILFERYQDELREQREQRLSAN